MQKKLINSQLSNWKTYEMYKRQFLTLAENVFEFKNMPEFIDTAFLNKQLLRNGAIAPWGKYTERMATTNKGFFWHRFIAVADYFGIWSDRDQTSFSHHPFLSAAHLSGSAPALPP